MKRKILLVEGVNSYPDGVFNLLELRLGNLYEIVRINTSDLKEYCNDKFIQLILIEEDIGNHTKYMLRTFKSKGVKVILLTLEVCQASTLNLELFDGFLLKDMATSHMLKVINEIINFRSVYVHPAYGYFFLQKIQKEKNSIFQ